MNKALAGIKDVCVDRKGKTGKWCHGGTQSILLKHMDDLFNTESIFRGLDFV